MKQLLLIFHSKVQKIDNEIFHPLHENFSKIEALAFNQSKDFYNRLALNLYFSY